MTTSTHRTSTTHRSRLARRLDRETGMGYQKALDTVREQADALLRQFQLERLDARGCDLMLRALLQQSLEFWGPGIGAHMWPEMYHPLFMGLPGPMSDAALKAVTRAGRTADAQAEPSGIFDPSWLATAGVEALDYDGEPDSDEDDEDGIDPEALEPLDEPDRWKRHVLAQGRRDAFVMPPQQSLSPDLREELQHQDPASARARLEQHVLDQPSTVEAYVLRAVLAFPGGATLAVDGPHPRPPSWRTPAAGTSAPSPSASRHSTSSAARCYGTKRTTGPSFKPSMASRSSTASAAVGTPASRSSSPCSTSTRPVRRATGRRAPRPGPPTGGLASSP